MFDRNTIIAFILIFIIFIGWSFLTKPKQQPPSQGSTPADSIQIPIATQDSGAGSQSPASPSPTFDTLALVTDTIPEKSLTVETQYFTATLSNKGAGITNLNFKHYHYSDTGNVGMLPEDAQAVPSVISNISGFSDSGLTYETDASDAELTRDSQSHVVTFRSRIEGKGEIVKQFTFYADRYDFDFQLRIDGVPQLGLDREYIVAWTPAIPPTETNLTDDFSSYKGGAHMGGEMRSFDSFEAGRLSADVVGATSWVGARTKYFAYIIYPKSGGGEGAYFRGSEHDRVSPDETYRERRISSGIVMASGANTTLEKSFNIFVGPLDYKFLKSYNADFEDFIDWGWKIIRPFSHAIYWITYQLHRFIPNYGVVIIVVAILLKLITFPLTRKSLKSMAAMKNLAPKMEELKVKYKSDPQKLNQSIMKLYKEEGVNPFSGCLLLLPQMPLLYGLYQVFRSTIEFRQAYFLPLWPDLSLPDPFPYIMPLIMTGAMFWQQKMSMTDPKMKMMVYLMPVIFFFFMKSLPVGLVLYWTAYSILSIFEQLMIKRNDTVINPQVK